MSINNLISHRPSVCLSEQKDSDPINTEKVKKDSKKDQHIFIISFSGILHMELFSHRSILTLNYWKHIKMLIFTTFLEMTISGIIQTAGMFEEVRIDKRLFSFDLISSDMTKNCYSSWHAAKHTHLYSFNWLFWRYWGQRNITVILLFAWKKKSLI